MGIKKDFGRYWIAGLIFAIIAGVIQWITGYYGVFVALYFESNFFWGLITGLIGVTLFIFVPWGYGRLTEWIYITFIEKK